MGNYEYEEDEVFLSTIRPLRDTVFAMCPEITESLRGESVRQLSIFADNKVGWLNELILLLSSQNIHVMALCAHDTTDTTIIKMIVDDHEKTRELLRKRGYAFTECELIAVEIDDESKIKFVTTALLEAEINIHYIYPFLMRPHGKSALAIRLEENDIAAKILSSHQLKVLSQTDISR